MKESISALLCFCAFLITCFIAMAFVADYYKKHAKQLKAEAIKRGLAEYVADDDGNPVWQWKPASQTQH